MNSRFCIKILLFICLGVCAFPGLSASEEAASSQVQPVVIKAESASLSQAKMEIDVELDAYYSNVGLYIPLSDRSMPDLGEADEGEVYKYLLRNMTRPQFLLVEAAIFPMPLLGTYLKSNHAHFYNDAGSGSFNIIESITAGFQEPYALSFFLGDVVRFTKKGEKQKDCNKGYMGIMVSYAPQHIKSNELINDDSFEIEWKLKGDRIFNDENLNWSFRIGSKIHDNPYIADVGYIGMRRSNLDFNSNPFSWLKNSSFEFKWDMALRDAEMLRQEYVLGKRFPLKDPHVAFTLDFGLIWENSHIYDGPLRNSEHHNFIMVLRPNIKF